MEQTGRNIFGIISIGYILDMMKQNDKKQAASVENAQENKTRTQTPNVHNKNNKNKHPNPKFPHIKNKKTSFTYKLNHESSRKF